MHIHYDARSLPILGAADAIIVGGSLAGVAAALAITRAGRKALLIESRTYLGRDITATLRLWLRREDVPSHGLIADLVQAAGHITLDNNEIALQPDQTKLFLEDALMGSGVDIIYGSYAVDVLQSDRGIAGVIIGNKSGRQALLAPLVIDATETALVARLAGATFEPETQETLIFCRTLEYIGRLSPTHTISVPRHFGLVGDCLHAHRGYHGPTHRYLEAQFAFPATEHTFEGTVKREIEARERSIELALYLQQETGEFSQTLLASCSYELHGRRTTALQGISSWAAELHGTVVSLSGTGPSSAGLDLSAFAGPLPGLWQLQEAARLPKGHQDVFLHPVTAAHAGTAVGEALVANWEKAKTQYTAPVRRLSQTYTTEGSLVIREQAEPQKGRCYPQQEVGPKPIPVLRKSEVLVVGGGTSGAVAAMTSGREGAQTTLVEMNPGLGGTETVGGVPEYWMGHRAGFMSSIKQAVEDMDRRLGFVPPSRWQQWSIEGRMHVLLQETLAAGVDVFVQALAIGVVMDDRSVRGVVTATPYGVYAFLADVTVDATGDGDVAAWAGADYVYGSEREHTVMWYSLPQIGTPGLSLGGNFTSMCDVSNIADYTRAILAGRRRRRGIHDHGIYLAPRESRHILGDVVLTFNDQLLHRRWPDVVNIFYSNYDIKGRSNTDWNLAGLISANLEIEFPYRALLPRGLDGVLVAGKAFSAASDAVPSIRMQPDLENLGGVVGMAAALAVRNRCSPRDIPLNDLQRRLVGVGLLPTGILSRALRPRPCTPTEINAWIDRLQADKPLYELNNMPEWVIWRQHVPFVEVCTAGPQAIPLLRKALVRAEGDRQVLIAQALAMCGDATGVPILIDRIRTLLADGPLPPRTAFILNTVPHLPDHAAMPDVVYLVYSLGMARDRRSLPIWQTIADRLDFSDDDFRHPFKAPYYYVDAVCYGAERLGDPAAIPILEKIHSHPLLHDQVLLRGFQADYMPERQATLELVVARALARCGSPRGLDVLITYLDDVRALLAEHAHSELIAITGEDFGKDAMAWRQWLRKQPSALSPRPWLGATDAVRAWGEEILIHG